MWLFCTVTDVHSGKIYMFSLAETSVTSLENVRAVNETALKPHSYFMNTLFGTTYEMEFVKSWVSV